MFNQKELQLLKIQRKINENIFLVREGIKNGKLKCELRI